MPIIPTVPIDAYFLFLFFCTLFYTLGAMNSLKDSLLPHLNMLQTLPLIPISLNLWLNLCKFAQSFFSPPSQMFLTTVLDIQSAVVSASFLWANTMHSFSFQTFHLLLPLPGRILPPLTRSFLSFMSPKRCQLLREASFYQPI